MKRRHMVRTLTGQVRCQSSQPNRRGSALLIVMSLLGLLALLGFVFYTFAAQERQNAEYFANAAKQFETESLGPDVYWDWALEQLIQGPRNNQTQSVLAGRRHSLIRNMFGQDVHPFNGQGVNVVLTATGLLGVDQDYNGQPDQADEDGDGSPDFPHPFLKFNDSPAAHGVDFDGDGVIDDIFERNLDQFPAPDVDYTYPDINNVFLSYIGKGLDLFNNEYDVIIPSFHRPQYLREFNGTSVVPIADWHINPATAAMVMRPHPDHLVVDKNGKPIRVGGVSTGIPITRFMGVGDPDLSLTTPPALPFPFETGTDLLATPPDTIPNEQGPFSFVGPIDPLNPPIFKYEFDVDNDNDGTDEGIWLDFGFPLQERADGKKYVVLFSMTVKDLDALMNLNVHGNLSGQFDGTPNNGVDDLTDGPVGGILWKVGPDGQPGVAGVNDDDPMGLDPANPTDDILELGWAGSDDVQEVAFISRSNSGVGPWEVNPLWALTGDPSDPAVLAAAFDQHNYFLQRALGTLPADTREAANIEWLFAMFGRGDWKLDGSTGDVSITDLYAGRNGELGRLADALGFGITNPVPSTNPFDYPWPGQTNRDDNADASEGEDAGGARSYLHPLDYSGIGRFWKVASKAKFADLIPVPGTVAGNPMRVLRYRNYHNVGTVRWALGADGLPGGGDDLPGLMIRDVPFRNVLFNDPSETIVDLDHTQQPLDEPFPPSELAFLHLSGSDLTNSGGNSSRLKNLFTFNFDPTNNPTSAVENRRRFTTLSWDRKSFSLPFFRVFGPDGKPGRANFDDDQNGITDDFSEQGAQGSDDAIPPWEFSADADRDRLFEFPPVFPGTDGKPGVPGVDDDQNGFVDDNAERGWPDPDGSLGIDDVRPFMVNVLTPPGVVPPRFVSDPFRPQLRRLLEVEVGNNDKLKRQLRLSVNQLLDVERLPGNPANPITGPLQFRPLTPHPQTLGNQSLSFAALPPFPPQNLRQQEFWARRDRQKMCRDIYVMLYILGGGRDRERDVNGNGILDPEEDVNGNGAFDPYFDYTSDNSQPLMSSPDPMDPMMTIQQINGRRRVYTNAQLETMAQFAVNLVDAMDRDNVITKFEFDRNLADGWNLDDNPYTPKIAISLATPEDPGKEVDLGVPANFSGTFAEKRQTNDRGVVFGVEAQQLSLSEALAIKAKGQNVDHPSTEFIETSDTEHFFFTYVELRNASPSAVAFDKEAWQIRVVPFGAGTQARAVTPRLAAGPVAGGGLYTIGSAAADGGPALTNSLFRVDPLGGSTFATIAPKSGLLGLPNGLDLIADLNAAVPANSPFRVTAGNALDFRWNGKQASVMDVDDATGTVNGALLQTGTVIDTTQAVVVQLLRRAHPNRTRPILPAPGTSQTDAQIKQQIDNPWVVVDTSTILPSNPLSEMPLAVFDPSLGVATELDKLKSRLRREPLADNKNFLQTEDPSFVVGTQNSLGFDNVDVATATYEFRLWQPHFDRDFASLGELLSVPIYPPSQPNQGAVSNLSPLTQVRRYSAKTAGAKFLMPVDPNGPFNSSGVFKDNRWYRLLEFLEVPTRTHQQLGNPLGIARVPGKINVNGLRHPEILAGMIDDREVIGFRERDLNQDGVLDPGEDLGNGVLDTEDFNGNGILDPSEDANGNGILDPGEDLNENGLLDPAEDGSLPGLFGLANGTLDTEDANANGVLDAGEDLPNGEWDRIPDRMGGDPRDWWTQFIRARDGIVLPTGQVIPDPVSGMYLPGVAGSRPFRSFAYAAHTNGTMANTNDARIDVEQTLLRSLPSDTDDDVDPLTFPLISANRNRNRRLFELGEARQHLSGAVDHYSKHRILSKLIGNTTTRSHAFAVYITVRSFEAIETPEGAVRIGGVLDELVPSGPVPEPEVSHRGFFIIDRSDIEKAYDPATNSFSWRELVKHRLTIN